MLLLSLKNKALFILKCKIVPFLPQLVFSYLYARFGMEVHVPTSVPRDVGNVSNPLGRDTTNRLFFLKFKISLIFLSSFLYIYSRCITVLFHDNPIASNSKTNTHTFSEKCGISPDIYCTAETKKYKCCCASGA